MEGNPSGLYACGSALPYGASSRAQVFREVADQVQAAAITGTMEDESTPETHLPGPRLDPRSEAL